MKLEIFISPSYKPSDFPEKLTLDNKIEIFIDRLKGWELGVALEMKTRGIAQRGFAVLNVVMSFFEMIGKYREGYLKDDQSKTYFKKGFKWVFPEIENDLPDLDSILDLWYKDARSGLYHIGMTKSSIMVSLDDNHGAFGYDANHRKIIINPDILTSDLVYRLEIYEKELHG